MYSPNTGNKCMTHNIAERYMIKARNRNQGRPLESNTRLIELDNGSYGIKYYYTTIVEIMADNRYRLRCNGHYTRTTLERINNHTPIHIYIYQKNWEWFVVMEPFITKFTDGMIVY